MNTKHHPALLEYVALFGWKFDEYAQEWRKNDTDERMGPELIASKVSAVLADVALHLKGEGK